MQTLLATRPIGRHASLIVLPAALLAAHCGGTQSQSLTNPSTHSAVVALRVGVAGNVAPTIAPGERLQLWAAATYADGASGDVTNAALWQSSNPAVATVSREGLLSAAAEGTVDVKATIDRISGSLRAEIRRGGCESATLSADALVYNAFGSYSSVKVATPLSDCRWTARSDADWLRMSGRDRTVYDPGTSGSGSFAYTVLANNFPVSRSGRITVSFANGGELIHSVAQEPPVSCSYVVTPDEGNFSADGGSGSFDLRTTPSNCRWTAVAFYDFYGIRLTSSSSGAGSAQVTYSVAANPTKFERNGSIQIAGLSGANPSASHRIRIAAR